MCDDGVGGGGEGVRIVASKRFFSLYDMLNRFQMFCVDFQGSG